MLRIRIDLKILVFLIIFYFTNQIREYLIIMFFCVIHEIGHTVKTTSSVVNGQEIKTYFKKDLYAKEVTYYKNGNALIQIDRSNNIRVNNVPVNGYFAGMSDVDKALLNIKTTVMQLVSDIKKSVSNNEKLIKTIAKYNITIWGIHNFYKIATNVNVDLAPIQRQINY